METETLTRKKPATGELNKLFVYGLFLGERMRDSYGMWGAKYTTVRNYSTIPLEGNIVAATPLEGYDLTGLLVSVDPEYWGKIDSLESGYDRIKISTSYGEAWMYVFPE